MSTPHQRRTKAERITKLANLAGWALTALSLMCGGTQAVAKENAQTGVAEVNGTKLYYETAGEGRPSSSCTAGWWTAACGTTR